tara:strand:+ start:3879 stop:4475 length:597 start_codon:yes stop_codon:yes gene_type:complete
MSIDRKKNTKTKILDAAFSVFAENGYQDTTISDIVSKSGLSKGAIYHHYGSKKELFISLIDHWEIFSFPNFYSKDNAQESASNALLRFTEVVYDAFKLNSNVFLAEIEFWALANKDPEIKKRSKVLYDKILKLFELVLKKGIRNGEFEDMDTKIVSIELLSVFQGINWFCLFNEDKALAGKYLKKSINIILDGIKKRS